jgi:prepilin-type N-terminal cleavage/methylation domain-containing protein
MDRSGWGRPARDGFTLVELVMVLAIAGVLIAIGMLQFSTYTKKSAIEAEVRTMFSDLMTARTQALFEKRDRAVMMTATTFAVYSSTVTTVAPVLSRTLPYSVVSNSMPDPLVFNSRGIVFGVSNASICIEPDDNPGGVDSLVISTTRIQIGKRDTGAACNASNIKTK